MSNWDDLYNNYSLSQIHSKIAFLNGESFRLNDCDFYNQAMSFICQVFRKARQTLDSIVDELIKENYIFAYPNEIRANPDSTILEWAKELSEKHGIKIPLSVIAWMCEIGNVNLCGTNPKWEKSGYSFDGNNDVWYTDPIVFQLTKEDILSQYDEWLFHKEEYGINEIGPFRISISPDYLHKANISGGPSYEIFTDSLCFDTILINERRGTGVVNYLRNSLLWGGFPGFEYIFDDFVRRISIQKNVEI